MQIIELETTTSTNVFAKQMIAKLYPQHFVVSSKEQTHGKGQQGNVWHSEKGKNLLFSVVIYPHTIKAEDQFIINKISALSVKRCIEKYLNTTCAIKWPNDMYIANQKIAGILIEHTISENTIKNTVVGIGINVNQKYFPELLPNPVSMYNISGIEYDLKTLLNNFIDFFNHYLNILEQNNLNIIDTEYLKALYNFEVNANYLHQNKQIAATIKGVDSYGRLILKPDEGNEICCSFKEIVFL